jgi:cytoskeleton protein RodZ
MNDTANIIFDDRKIMTHSDNNNNNNEATSYSYSMSTGNYLKSVRLKKNFTEEDIYKSLKIKARIISAIENQHYNYLPDTISVSALVKQYAQLLGLDGVAISTAYKNEMIGTDQKIEVVFPDKLPSSCRPFKKSIFATLIMLALYSVWHFLSNTHNILPNITETSQIATDEKTISPAKKISAQSEISETFDTISLDIKPAIDFKIIKKPDIILKTASGDSWIEIKDTTKNRIIYSGILKDGDSYKVPSDLTGLRLKAGNSYPLSIMINGEALKILPKKNRVLRNFNIDSDALLEAYKKQQQE